MNPDAPYRNTFIGRKYELEKLAELLEKKTASFVVIKGRRRIGKSRLIKEFGHNFEAVYVFSGLPPTPQTTAKDQLDEFSRQMAHLFHTAPASYQDWGDVFWALAERVRTGRILLFFDEISWMGSQDHTFLAKIKNLWDLHLKENDKLVFVLCGSVSSWIEKNILSSSGFVGRISYTLTLRELSLNDSCQFWPSTISLYEKLKVLSITGGVPKYLEEINTKVSAEENIKRLCFTEGGFFVDEFERMFSDILLRDSPFYKKILHSLATGAKDAETIQKELDLLSVGRLLEYLHELESAGFITRDYTWDLKSGHDSKLSHYRLSDNYTRFYIKYIEPNLSKIRRGTYVLKSLASLPGWHSMMGLQFENLVLNNRPQLYRLLKIDPPDIVCDNPFFQRKTKTAPGCQIDYMIQTRFQSLYMCEIKFSKNPIDISVIQEVRERINALKRPKGFSIRPVLIHVNGVTEALMDEDYFSDIVDFEDLVLMSSQETKYFLS